MKAPILAFVLVLVLLLSGCVQQPTSNTDTITGDQQTSTGEPETQASEQTFEEISSGNSNAKCVFETFDGKVATWWFKGTDYKFEIPGAGLYVKKGDYIYITVPGTTECKFYNIVEMNKILGVDYEEGETVTNEEIQGMESWVDVYKGYKMDCQFNIVTDSDFSVDTENCENLTAAMRESYDQVNAAMGELCTQCQSDPETFGGDCSAYCS